MSFVEWIASALGLICVLLAVRRNIWTYAFGIASTGLLAAVVFDARLYSAALLQIFFVAINLYGWGNWRRAEADLGEVVVARMGWRARAGWLAATAFATAAWGGAMAGLTDAALPWADAAIAMASVVAQILMARRRVENWLVWIVVDLASIPLFASQGLYVMAGLYAGYLMLAVAGYVAWRRAERGRVE